MNIVVNSPNNKYEYETNEPVSIYYSAYRTLEYNPNWYMNQMYKYIYIHLLYVIIIYLD